MKLPNHREARIPKGYEVEFMTMDGETIMVVSLYASLVRPVGRREIAHVRTLEQVPA